jgi:hypothetical protein
MDNVITINSHELLNEEDLKWTVKTRD